MLDNANAVPASAQLPRGGIEQRRHPRHLVNWPATCVFEGGGSFLATIIDVSEGGFGLKGAGADLAPGSFLYIDFDQIGAFRCRLAWSHGGRFGVEIVEDGSAEEDVSAASLTEALRHLRAKKEPRG